MIIRIQQRFGTIQWRLTGTYVLVSLLFALTMLTIFVAALAWLLNSNLLLTSFADEAQQLAVALRPQFVGQQVNVDRVAAQLRVLSSEIIPEDESLSTVPGQVQIQANINPSDADLVAVVLDREGRVITSTLNAAYQPGVPLLSYEADAINQVVALALRGITDTAQLGTWHEPGRQPAAAAPILDDDGRVLGAVYWHLVNFPSTRILLENVPSLLLTVIVPWTTISIGVGLIYSWLAGRGLSKRLKRLTAASAALATGDLTRRVSDPSLDEIGQLGRQFNTMAEQLAEHMRALRSLAEQNAQLAEHAAQLATVEERNRLARDLHDSVSQELFSMTMLAAAARRSIDSRPAIAAGQLAEVESTARRALQETRSLIFALRPAQLDDRGLGPALRDLAAAARERQGLEVKLSISGERYLPLDHEQALFRIAQEALANVARHSTVRAAEMQLCYDDGTVELVVRDRGRGFDPQAARSARSLGLISMAERAAALGGNFVIESAPGHGTTMCVKLPVMQQLA